MTDYLLGSSWISSSQVKLGEINNAERFLGILIENFPTVAVQSIFPTVVFSGRRCAKQSLHCDSLNNQFSGKSIVKEKLEDAEDDREETYTISNGSNRMRIKFVRFTKVRPPVLKHKPQITCCYRRM